MSRYVAPQSNGEVVSYGYDRPMGEYFIHLEKGGEIVFAIGSYFTMNQHPDYPGKLTFSNSELYKILSKYKYINPEHLNALMMDEPF